MLKQSELILNPDGSLYHINLKPSEIVHKIILVGDQNRVDRVAGYFDTASITTTKIKREFRTITGSYQGEAITVMSTGIGTDNIDIVLNEVDALVNIDLSTRKLLPAQKSLKILRLGTCGCLQASIPVGSLILSKFAIGGDGLMHFYQKSSHPPSPEHQEIQAHLAHFSKTYDLPATLLYPVEGDSGLSAHLAQTAPDIYQGITFTAAGFYGPQGRSLGRIATRYPELADNLASHSWGDYKVMNMEMETAGILGLGSLMDHQMGSLSVALANRAQGSFADNPAELENKLIKKGLEIMKQW